MVPDMPGIQSVGREEKGQEKENGGKEEKRDKRVDTGRVHTELWINLKYKPSIMKL